ncbi:Abscisic acid G-protein coupled receptor-domain-containing protein [Podospora fimiseda]|uniref:Abscisic acid G-protein coupled receptor-domain-containing protein n=1 Tax=Podospora fimiseda TaxID=252190 RepID=A0AAN7BJS8_9PEZI|nr:Abscisic acid G-protein coupled receptor-domain-containing protein [Podospora fimiseda]
MDDDDGTSCSPTSCGPPSSLFSLLFASSPFLITFFFTTALSYARLFPLLAKLQQHPTSSNSTISDGEDHFLPVSAPVSLRQAHAEHAEKSTKRKVAGWTFAVTIGLSVVLGELILAEVALEALTVEVRGLLLRVTVPSLMVLLVGVIPFLEVQSVVGSWFGLRFGRDGRTGRLPRVAWGLLLGTWFGWLGAFWYIGRVVKVKSSEGGGLGNDVVMGKMGLDSTGMMMGMRFRGSDEEEGGGGLSRACLERIGVIGILSMALLSGFASVSSPWHTFADNRAYKKRPITDADIARKQVGLDATGELLATKRHRLRSLQRKAQAVAEGIGGSAAARSRSLSPGGAGLVGKMLGSLKTITGNGSGEAAEIKALQVEISGLETMEANLAASLASLKARQAAHARDGTTLGRLFAIPQYVFALYCVYRIFATVLTTIRRSMATYPSAYSPSFASSDPISRLLGLLAKHWDPKLDQVAWARQISFLLSGVILAASANSVLQTFRIFAKWMPGLLYQAQSNLALLIGQLAATYVISAALLLRSSLPREVGRSVGDALESALEPGFVDRWFEGWFLLASVLTAVGIWIGRKVSISGELDEWDEYGGEEMGNVGQKRS